LGVYVRSFSYCLVLWLGLAGLGGFSRILTSAQPSSQLAAAISVASAADASVDPNKAPSEFNHHMAGWALMGVGFLVLAGLASPRLRALRYVWPALFLLAGLFLAFWSDGEIWPRGNLSWAWLLHHDQEARQHKVYALLLIGMGLVEYLRARGALNRFWRVWSFPILAVVGASLLMVHDHTQGSGAHTPEAQAYLVNPALDVDGSPRTATAPAPMPGMDHSAMDMDHSQMDHSMMAQGSDPASMDHGAMDHSGMSSAAMSTDPAPDGHHHHMTPSMLMVEHEHFWFMIVGLGIALFKLISDADLWRNRIVPYVWPAGMVVLGVLLVLYRE